MTPRRSVRVKSGATIGAPGIHPAADNPPRTTPVRLSLRPALNRLSRPTSPMEFMSVCSFESRPTGSRRPRRSGGHPAVCADCETSTTVPFRPRPDRPVYCPPCFTARRNGSSAAPRARDSEPRPTSAPLAADAPDVSSAFPGIALSEASRAAIARMGIAAPTPIQEETIPQFLAGRDLIGQARTGSGKTLAFAVPLAERCDPSVAPDPGSRARAHARAGHPGGQRR